MIKSIVEWPIIRANSIPPELWSFLVDRAHFYWPANAGAPPQQSAGRPRGFSALCWRRRGLRTDRRVRGRCADRDVPLVFLLRTAVSEAREAEPAPDFAPLVARRRCPASLVARCSSRRRTSPRLRASANRCSVRAEFFRLSSKNPRRARAPARTRLLAPSNSQVVLRGFTAGAVSTGATQGAVLRVPFSRPRCGFSILRRVTGGTFQRLSASGRAVFFCLCRVLACRSSVVYRFEIFRC